MNINFLSTIIVNNYLLSWLEFFWDANWPTLGPLYHIPTAVTTTLYTAGWSVTQGFQRAFLDPSPPPPLQFEEKCLKPSKINIQYAFSPFYSLHIHCCADEENLFNNQKTMSFFSRWSFLLILWLWCLIQGWYFKEKLGAGYSWGWRILCDTVRTDEQTIPKIPIKPKINVSDTNTCDHLTFNASDDMNHSACILFLSFV